MHKTKTGKYIRCQWCGKLMYMIQSRIKKQKTYTCSAECASELKKFMFTEIRQCGFCHEWYSCKPGSPKRFCSVECQWEWQKTNTGFKNPKFQGKTIPCDYCGELFEIHKYNLDKYEHHFCSAQCRKDWHREVFSQDEEWKEKSRIRGAETTKMQLGKCNTLPQIIVNKYLSSMKIKYQNEYCIKYYSVDNYLDDYNLIIEVMGDYWHYNISNPKINKNEPNKIQKHRIDADRRKHTYIKNYLNIEVLYLWEYDIINNFDLCEKLIQLYIENNGVLSNYHSYNYTLKDNEIILKDEIINSLY